MMKKLPLLLGLIGCFWCAMVWAVKLPDLYQIDLPVTTQLEDERAEAAKSGFLQILIRLTGDADIGRNPVIKPALKRADYYVREISYSAPTTASATYFIHLNFDKTDVNRLLQKAGMTYWGNKRPSILVWLTYGVDPHTAEIVSSESAGDIYDLMLQQGKKLGLPLMFPMMDVTDLGLVSADDVVAVTMPILRLAGQRYAPKAYLVGSIQAKNKGYQGQWTLFLEDRQWGWSLEAKSPEEIISVVMNQVSQTLARRYQLKPVVGSM